MGLEEETVAAIGWDVSQRRDSARRCRTVSGYCGRCTTSSRTPIAPSKQVRALLLLAREELGIDCGTLFRIEGKNDVFETVDDPLELARAGDAIEEPEPVAPATVVQHA